VEDLPRSIFAHYSADSAQHYHRLLQPFRFLQPEFPGVRLLVGPDPGHAPHAAYIVHGIVDFFSYPQIAKWKRQGGLFVWSMDDDYLSVPDWNPAKPGDRELGSHRLLREIADLILVSTPALAHAFGALGCGDKVMVAPNLLDLDLYPPAGHPPEDGPVRVAWAGSATHSKDMDLVAAACSRVLRDLGPGKVNFHWLGEAGPPPDLLRDHLHKGVWWHEQVSFQRYWATIAQIRPHVWLAPMVDCPFSRAKSNIRVLDGWALSAAVIASPVGEYTAIHHGDTGLFAAGDWVDEIRRVVTDRERRERIATRGRARLESQWSWQGDHSGKQAWRRVIRRIVESARAPA